MSKENANWCWMMFFFTVTWILILLCGFACKKKQIEAVYTGHGTYRVDLPNDTYALIDFIDTNDYSYWPMPLERLTWEDYRMYEDDEIIVLLIPKEDILTIEDRR